LPTAAPSTGCSKPNGCAHPATAQLPVLAVTASAFGDVREAARDAGCLDFVPKPIRAEVLFSKLRQHLGVTFVSPRPTMVAEPLSSGQPVEGLANRLRGAAVLGDVSELQTLVRELAAATASERALGQQIARMTHDFDFAALQDLAASLATMEANQA